MKKRSRKMVVNKYPCPKCGRKVPTFTRAGETVRRLVYHDDLGGVKCRLSAAVLTAVGLGR